MAIKNSELVSFKLTRGIRLNGKSIYPTTKVKTGSGKDEKIETIANIVSIPLSLAKDLAIAGKGEVVKEKANVVFKQPQQQDDDLDAVFGGSSGDEGGDK